MAKLKSIPVNSMDDHFTQGISLERMTIKKADFSRAAYYQDAIKSHRDEGHTFHIVEKGSVLIEIDFQKYKVKAPAVVYMHPNQIHRILNFNDVTVCSIAIKNENLNPAYLHYLDEIAPAKPLALTTDSYLTIAESFSFCQQFAKDVSKPIQLLLRKDSCNTLIGLITSLLLVNQQPTGKISRLELIAKSFKALLEKNYHTVKRPAGYAEILNISVHYLNESLKTATGLSASQHIQDRIILEAKRLLYHSDKSVKEIAVELGYEDYPYFSRLFTKAADMTALAFRNKRHD